MLDRNYAWKLGRSRCFLDVDPETIAHYSLSNGPPVSELLLVYMHLAQVQDGLIPFLRDSHTHPPRTGVGVVPSFDSARERLFRQMEDIRRRIDQVSEHHSVDKPMLIRTVKIASVSHEWKGLDASSEISALDFAYHSIMTAIFHFTQITPGWILDAGELYLQSARQGLSALVSMCLSSDKQGTVAFLHWWVSTSLGSACRILITMQDPPLLPPNSLLHPLLQRRRNLAHRRLQPPQNSRKQPDPERHGQSAHRHAAAAAPGIRLPLAMFLHRSELPHGRGPGRRSHKYKCPSSTGKPRRRVPVLDRWPCTWTCRRRPGNAATVRREPPVFRTGPHPVPRGPGIISWRRGQYAAVQFCMSTCTT